MPPYPPSWFDRFAAWVDGLPGPPWGFYLLVAIGVAVVGSAIEWIEGAYPAGTFNASHVWTLGNFAYLLALIHYLDKSAASAIASFRPILATAASGAHPSLQVEAIFARLSYQLTTLPPRPTIIATIAGAIFAIVTYILQTSTGGVPSYLAGTAGTTISNASVLALLIVQNAITGVLVYHTVHQLALISRIYTQHARINVYQLQPLYALSMPGAFTAIGIILYIYVWAATSASAPQAVGPVEIALSVSFTAIAGVTFALPLLGAHRRLVAEKNILLREASSRFQAAAEQLLQDLDGRRLGQMDNLNKALASLEIVQAALRRVPTWPWQPGAVRGLLAALFLPLAIWAIQLFLGRFLGT
ncbi:MAG TPA: hypothetical protein VI729_04820 [Anaerolineales bacterium]|nr:hypothetical protein [Anaerolineales bacterium]